MPKKTFILSSAGLKNIIRGKDAGNDFIFMFGNENLIMNNYAAEFISPKISNLHQIDPTIQFISFIDDYNVKNSDFIQNLFNPNILSKISMLAQGKEIEISEDDIQYLMPMAILLENDELLTELTNLSELTSSDSEKAIDNCLTQLQIADVLHEKFNISKFDYTKLIDKITSQFYTIDPNKLKHLSPSTLLQIIPSNKLKITSEDSLFDFITAYNEHTKIPIIDFYQQLELDALSETKFKEFIELLDFNLITSSLWTQLKNCFYFNYNRNHNSINRYCTPLNKSPKILNIETEISKPGEIFKGIIYQLSLKCNGNVDDYNLVKITTSSTWDPHYLGKYVADFTKQSFYHSADEQYPWIQYDFLAKKILPTYYSIKTNADFNSCLKSWVIEGSNSSYSEDWHQLDKQENCSIFPVSKAHEHTFKIPKSNEYYRFLRLRSTGKNNNNTNYLVIEKLEFYGFVNDQLNAL